MQRAQRWEQPATSREREGVTGAGLGLGIEGWIMMLCWERLVEAATGRGIIMYRMRHDRINEVQMIHLSWRCSPLLGHLSALKEYLISWLLSKSCFKEIRKATRFKTLLSSYSSESTLTHIHTIRKRKKLPTGALISLDGPCCMILAFFFITFS